MAEKKIIGLAGLTGRYVYCPNSGAAHALFAKEVTRSDKGNLWFRCVCGFRGYFPKGSPLPHMTRESALATGAMIPDEFTGAPQAAPIPQAAPNVNVRRGP